MFDAWGFDPQGSPPRSTSTPPEDAASNARLSPLVTRIHSGWLRTLISDFTSPLRFKFDYASLESVMFIHLGLFKKAHKPAVTLNTAFAHLGLCDAPFDVLVMCEDCHRILPADTSSDTACTLFEILL